MSSEIETSPPRVEMPKSRFVTGVCMWITGQFSPLIIPFIMNSGLSDTVKAALSTFIFFGLPSLFTFTAVVILGKEGFNYLKVRLFAVFKKHVRPVSVSRKRFLVGIVFLVATMVVAWISPYLAPFIPFIGKNQLAIAFACDTAILISFLILGGDFWGKLRGLFLYEPSSRIES